MTEIKLYKTSPKGLKLIGMTIPFVLIGIWMITNEPFGTFEYIMGWICTCFFGLGIPVGLFQTFDRRPQIIINENGIWDRTTNQDEIKWEQIIEAYPLDIFDQKFISMVTEDTFLFNNKQYKWASKINKTVNAQKLNLHLGQINIDVNHLTDLINKLSKANKEERKILIKSFTINRANFSFSDLHKILIYISISIILLLLSLSSITAFMTIMIVMGVAALTARWYWGSTENSKIRKYAGIITWLGVVNMVLFLLTMKAYDYTTNEVGFKLSANIENYKVENLAYPKELEFIKNGSEFNIMERYIIERIVYNATEEIYELKLKPLFKKWKIYDKELKEWK